MDLGSDSFQPEEYSPEPLAKEENTSVAMSPPLERLYGLYYSALFNSRAQAREVLPSHVYLPRWHLYDYYHSLLFEL